MQTGTLHPNIEKHFKANLLINSDNRTLNMMKSYLSNPTTITQLPPPSTDGSDKYENEAFLYPNGNSLYEQTKKRKLARIKASDPVLNQESNSEEIYSVNKAVSELGGFKDTLASIKDSLIENEIANISRSLRKGHSFGKEFNKRADAVADAENTHKFSSKAGIKSTTVETLIKCSYGGDDSLRSILNNEKNECLKRAQKLESFKKWTCNQDQKSSKGVSWKDLEKGMFLKITQQKENKQNNDSNAKDENNPDRILDELNRKNKNNSIAEINEHVDDNKEIEDNKANDGQNDNDQIINLDEEVIRNNAEDNENNEDNENHILDQNLNNNNPNNDDEIE